MTRRSRGRNRERKRAPIDTTKYRRLQNPYEPMRVISDDQVEHLHSKAVQYLADEGIRVLLPEARQILAEAGALVADEMVRFDPEHVAASIVSAPSSFTLHGLHPDRDVEIGGTSLNFGPAGGPPFVSDLELGRRPGTLVDHRNFLKLVQSYDVLAITGPSAEPSDIPLDIRHLHSTFATLTLSDKAPFVYARGRQRVQDAVELAKLRLGIDDHDEFVSAARLFTNINVNSPRQLDIPMNMAIIDFARLNQPVIMTPFTLAGAMAPVTLAGALVLQHLEALAAITLAQTVRPGAPVVYGAFTSNVDMKSGAPSFGTPEAIKGAYASGQLARHIQIPWRSSGSSTSNAVDAQAGYETMMNMIGAIYGGANWIFHAAGWQEGGLTASYEKFILDIEMCQMFAETMLPLVINDDELALDAITEVGPGGHFFGVDHTMERFEQAFYQPIAFNRANFEQWTEDGSQQSDRRANAVWKQTLADYTEPPIAPGVTESMQEFVDRRVSEGGAPPD